MRRISLTLVATSLALLLQAVPVHAQASRTWVSGVGDDANPCSRTAPCKTFAGAISKTIVNGEINCLDPGGFGAVTITKSITIDCHEAFGSILYSGTNGINIPFNNFIAAGETRKTVRLRNLNLNGVDTGVIGIRITGDGRVQDIHSGLLLAKNKYWPLGVNIQADCESQYDQSVSVIGIPYVVNIVGNTGNPSARQFNRTVSSVSSTCRTMLSL
jgi:hypothetical protein